MNMNQPLLNTGGDYVAMKEDGGHSSSSHEMQAVDSHSIKMGDVGGVESQHGLTSAEVAQRLAQYGPNALPEKIIPEYVKILKPLWGWPLYKPKPIPLMLWLAIVISLAVKDYVDFAVIMVLHLLNTAIAYIEERKAGDAVAALKKSLAPKAMVFRDRNWFAIPARDLVPGDLLKLKLGDIAPADCKMIAGGEAAIDQSGLTGESLPVTKVAGDTIYSGTTVKRGEVEAVVAATGASTEFGKAASLISSVEQQGQFQIVMNKIALGIVIVALVVNVIMISVSLARHQDAATVVQRALVLLVASIPIALPVVCTTVMAAGSRRLAEQNAVVTRLSAVEELSSMTILCSDKTGTLTLNQLQMDAPWLCESAYDMDADKLAFYSAMSTVAIDCDAIDTAVRGAAQKKGLLDKAMSWKQLEFLPFDPMNRRTTVVVQSPDGKVTARVIKGAPNFVLGVCRNKDKVKDLVDERVGDYASRGLRSLGVAVAFLPAGSEIPPPGASSDALWPIEFVGLISMFDPPRVDSAAVIEKANDLGVGVKMISGDHLKICLETGRRLGLGGQILGSEELHKHQPGASLNRLIYESDGFAEVFPEDKYNIVAALQSMGCNCGMTGDGVNDAPALKKANVGFAVKGATAAAQGAADVVLLSEGLSVIITAIVRSRKIFQRVKNYCIYRVNISLTLLFFFAIMILAFQVELPAIIIVLMALLNDFTIMTISADKVIPSNKPDGWNIPAMLFVSSVMGFVSTSLCILSYISFQNAWIVEQPTDSQMKSLIYAQISLMNQITVFVARTHKNLLSRRPGYALLSAVVTQMIVTFILAVTWPFGQGMDPAPVKHVILVVVFTIVAAGIHDIVKLVVYEILNRPGQREQKEEIQMRLRRAMTARETPKARQMRAGTVRRG